MRQHFILADQRGGGDLRHHKSRIEAGASGEKRRQAFIQCWIDEALKPPLGNSGERAEGDTEEVEHECDRLAMKISTGEDVAVFSGGASLCLSGRGARSHTSRKHQRIIHCGIDFYFHHLAAMGKCVAHSTMDLRNAAERVRILHAGTDAMRLANLAAL